MGGGAFHGHHRPLPLSCLLQERVFLSVSNYIFTAIFVVEMMVKVHRVLGDPGICLWPCGRGCNHVYRAWVHKPVVCTLQVVALGLVSGEHAYLQSSWNILDGVLVLVSLVDIVVAMASAGGAKILGILRVLRLLRTLRPLRWMGPRGGAKGADGGRGAGPRVGRGPGRRGSAGLLLVAAPLGAPSKRVPSGPLPGSSAVRRASNWWWRL